jgi:cytoskeletal protein RodZ
VSFMTHLGRLVAVLFGGTSLAALLVGCGGDNPPPPAPTTPSLSAAPSPTATPAPSSAPSAPPGGDDSSSDSPSKSTTQSTSDSSSATSSSGDPAPPSVTATTTAKDASVINCFTFITTLDVGGQRDILARIANANQGSGLAKNPEAYLDNVRATCSIQDQKYANMTVIAVLGLDGTVYKSP